MRNLKLLLMLLAIVSLALQGCKKDENPEPDPKKDPTITMDGASDYISGDKDVKPGSPFQFKFVAQKGPDGKDLDSIIVSVVRSAVPTVSDVVLKVKLKSGEQSTANRTVSNVTQTVEGTETWTIYVVDNDRRKAVKTLTLTVKNDAPPPPPPPVVAPTTLNASFSPTNMYYSTSRAMSIDSASGAANAADIDLTYFFSSASGANFASPVARSNADLYYTWAINWGANTNSFKYTNLISAQFDSVVNKLDLKGLYDNAVGLTVLNSTPATPNGTRIVSNSTLRNAADLMAPGKVYAFTTNVNGVIRYGLMKINTVASSRTGTTTVTIKLEPLDI